MEIGHIGTVLMHQRHGVRVFLYVWHAPKVCVIVPMQVESAMLKLEEMPDVVSEIAHTEGLSPEEVKWRVLLRSLQHEKRVETWKLTFDEEGVPALSPTRGRSEVLSRVRAAVLSHQNRERMFPELEQSTTAA